MEVPGAIIMEYTQLSGAVDEGSIGIPIAIEVGPDELLDAGNARERMNRGKRAIAVVAQDCRRTGLSAEYNIEVAVGLDVHGPGTGVRRVENRSRELRLRSYIRELLWRVLSHEAHAASAGEHQVGFEIVVEVQRQH